MIDAAQERIQRLIESESGIFLDLGCGDHREKRAIGMDMFPYHGVDIVHDIEATPWPIPDECCHRVLASHIFEHIQKNKILWVMAECHRVLKTHGQLMIALPYGTNYRALQDPTHYNSWVETTAEYFDCDRMPWCTYREIYQFRNAVVPCFKIELSQWTSPGDLTLILAKRGPNEHGKFHEYLGKTPDD